MKGTKRFGNQSCDNCNREIEVASSDEWSCPYCGYDNKAGVVLGQNAMRVATEASRVKAAQKRQSKTEARIK